MNEPKFKPGDRVSYPFDINHPEEERMLGTIIGVSEHRPGFLFSGVYEGIYWTIKRDDGIDGGSDYRKPGWVCREHLIRLVKPVETYHGFFN